MRVLIDNYRKHNAVTTITLTELSDVCTRMVKAVSAGVFGNQS
jgi:hypothetical protein